jgi:hypothetical protein
MARTVVYDAGAANQRPADGAASKIVKYVPVEVITIISLFFAAWTVTGNKVWIYVSIGAAMNVLYLFSVAKQGEKASPPTPAPKWWFYPLSIVAFGLWSMATLDPVASAAHLGGSTESGQRAFVLALAAFSVPVADTIFTSIGSPNRTQNR